MRVVMIGVSHRTAALELRERLSLSADQVARILDDARSSWPHIEVAALSTCNRTELYVAKPPHEPPTVEDLCTLLARACAIEPQTLLNVLIHREQEQAIAHLFRVCSGLDSMVLGETQIVGQVKRAYESCAERQSVGPVLHRVFQSSLSVAKQVRTATGIDAGRVSVGSAAIDFARQVFETFTDKTVVGVGAGEMAKVTLRHMLELAPQKLYLVNRTPARAHALAESLGLSPAQGGPRPWEALDQLLVEADMLVTSTGSREPIITVERMKPLIRLRRSRPLVFIDIAVPRDVEERVASLRNTYVYDLDDLQAVVARTHEDRRSQVDQAERMIHEAVRNCLSEVQHRDIGQLIKALRARLHALGALEQERTLRKIAAADPQDVPALVQEHTSRLINKILHLPIDALDHRRSEAPLGFYSAALRKLFQLDTGEPPEPPESPESPERPNDGAAAPPAESRDPVSRP